MKERNRSAVAIIGAGPSGIYAADALARSGAVRQVDVIDALPAPFGLARYGVAPDHLKTRNIVTVLSAVLEQPNVRFLGGVRLGRDVTVEQLRDCYAATVLAVGQPADRRLAIPGERLAGVLGARELVNWYCGHPSAQGRRMPLDGSVTVIVGAGNVAIDIARILVRDPEDFRPTAIPDAVLEALRASKVTDVHILIRRGPRHVRFTSVELRELGEIPGVTLSIDGADHADYEGADAPEASVIERRRIRTVTAIFQEWAARPHGAAPKRIYLHFHTVPVAVRGSARVTGVTVRSTRAEPSPASTIPAELLVTAVGQRGEQIPGLPFDPETGVIPNSGGRVTGPDGQAVPGLYVTGWARRGATGVIGTNRADAKEVADAVVDDLATVTVRTGSDVASLLEHANVRYVDWTGWLRLREYERAQGRIEGSSVTVGDLQTMLSVCGQHDAADLRA